MEPLSTAFRRALAALGVGAVICLDLPADAEARAGARGAVTMGHVQAVRVVPSIPTHRGGVPHIVHRQFDRQHFVDPHRRFAQHRFGRGRHAYLSLPYAPYIVDTGGPSAPAYAGDYPAEPGIAYEQPVCVRPLIIEIKPAKHAGQQPHVIYGRPPVC
jgi:hypothetical protein